MSRHKSAVVLAAVFLVCCGALILGQKVNAAGEGKITGTVKLDGTAPHMKGIDMSKDPYCAKAHANDPAQLKPSWLAPTEDCRMWFFTSPDGLTGGALTKCQRQCRYSIRRTACIRRTCLALDAARHTRSSPAIKPPTTFTPMPNPMTGNIPWNQSQPPGAPPIVKSWKAEEVIPVKCNIHPWMHGWHVVVKGPYATTDASGNYTIDNVPPGKLYGDGVAGSLRHPDAKGDGCGWQAGNGRFYL